MHARDYAFGSAMPVAGAWVRPLTGCNTQPTLSAVQRRPRSVRTWPEEEWKEQTRKTTGEDGSSKLVRPSNDVNLDQTLSQGQAT